MGVAGIQCLWRALCVTQAPRLSPTLDNLWRSSGNFLIIRITKLLQFELLNFIFYKYCTRMLFQTKAVHLSSTPTESGACFHRASLSASRSNFPILRSQRLSCPILALFSIYLLKFVVIFFNMNSKLCERTENRRMFINFI